MVGEWVGGECGGGVCDDKYCIVVDVVAVPSYVDSPSPRPAAVTRVASCSVRKFSVSTFHPWTAHDARALEIVLPTYRLQLIASRVLSPPARPEPRSPPAWPFAVPLFALCPLSPPVRYLHTCVVRALLSTHRPVWPLSFTHRLVHGRRLLSHARPLGPSRHPSPCPMQSSVPGRANARGSSRARSFPPPLLARRGA